MPLPTSTPAKKSGPAGAGSATRLQVAGVLTDKEISIDRLQLNGRAVALTGGGTIARNEAADLNLKVDLGLPDLATVSPGIVGSLQLSGKVKGPSNSLTADTELTSHSIHSRLTQGQPCSHSSCGGLASVAARNSRGARGPGRRTAATECLTGARQGRYLSRQHRAGRLEERSCGWGDRQRLERGAGQGHDPLSDGTASDLNRAR